MSGLDDAAGRVAPRALARGTFFLVLWLALSGADPADLPAGLVAVVAATWTSLILLPPGSSRVSLVHSMANGPSGRGVVTERAAGHQVASASPSKNASMTARGMARMSALASGRAAAST